MFDSGLYVDAIGKYVRHDNHYSASEIEMPEQDYRSHSWYLGTETGWRFSLPDETLYSAADGIGLWLGVRKPV